MAVLNIENVSKTFGETRVLEDINIAMAEGEFLILVGPSGCGKSTLLNMIAGLETITEGQITLDGRSVNAASPRERNIAMVFQFYALYPNMNVRRNIEFGLKMRGVAKKERGATVDRVARMLQIEDLLDRKPAQLSGGQRQRVAIGRALARDPALFLLTSRCRIWMPSCGWKCAPRSNSSISAWPRPWSMSPMTRSRP